MTNSIENKVTISPLLQCLAHEEADIHRRKIKGARVKLNQELFSIFSSNPHITLKKEYYQQVCPAPSPSLSLLRVILLHRERTFEQKSPQSNQVPLLQTLTELSRKSGELLMLYLSYLQATVSQTDCLKQKIGPLKNIYQKYQTIEGDVEIDQLIEKKEIEIIFNQLKNMDQITNACQVTATKSSN